MRTRLGCIVAFMVLSVGLALAAEKQIIRRPGTKTGGNYSPGILASFTILVGSVKNPSIKLLQFGSIHVPIPH